MSFSSRSFVLCILAGLVLSTSSGCFLGKNAFLGFAAIPIPISPWLQDHYEDVAWEKERYGRSPILGPLTADGPDFGMDEPSDDQVFRKLVEIKRVEGNWPMLHEVQLNDVRIFKEKCADYIDPPRHYPLVGPAQLHHVHWKCTLYYSRKTRVGWPVPHTITDQDSAEVIYIDKNHLHMVGNVDTGKGANF